MHFIAGHQKGRLQQDNNNDANVVQCAAKDDHFDGMSSFFLSFMKVNNQLFQHFKAFMLYWGFRGDIDRLFDRVDVPK